MAIRELGTTLAVTSQKTPFFIVTAVETSNRYSFAIIYVQRSEERQNDKYEHLEIKVRENDKEVVQGIWQCKFVQQKYRIFLQGNLDVSKCIADKYQIKLLE
jgi:hypothetical protein